MQLSLTHFRYLPSPPYQDNPVLHLYAGLTYLYLAQPAEARARHTNTRTLRDAEHYFERAKSLDPDNVVAAAWLEKARQLVSLNSSSQMLTHRSFFSDPHACSGAESSCLSRIG